MPEMENVALKVKTEKCDIISDPLYTEMGKKVAVFLVNPVPLIWVSDICFFRIHGQ